MRVGAPFVVGSATSRRAAVEILPSVGRIQRRIYRLLRKAGDYGMTADEIEVEGPYRGSTVRPRLCELEARGLVWQTKRTRLTRSRRQAVVWRAYLYITPPPERERCPHCGQPMPRR